MSIENITPVTINPLLFQGDLRPNIGIFYLFDDDMPGFFCFGLCREFRLSLPEFLKTRKLIIQREDSYEFRDQERLLTRFKNEDYQAVRTSPVDGISFKKLSEIVAYAYFQGFSERLNWLRYVDLPF